MKLMRNSLALFQCPCFHLDFPIPPIIHILRNPDLVYMNMESVAEPLIPEANPPSQNRTDPMSNSTKLPWIPLAALSGACAAFNGVFAKLCAFPYPLHL